MLSQTKQAIKFFYYFKFLIYFCIYAYFHDILNSVSKLCDLEMVN